jgi:hypothetical protein
MEINKYQICQIVKIYDGDSVLVKPEKEEEANVRFSYIDCFEAKTNSSIHTYLPESNILNSQYKWSELAKDDLVSMIILNNNNINLKVINYDGFYKRYVAEVYDDFGNLYQFFL